MLLIGTLWLYEHDYNELFFVNAIAQWLSYLE